MKEAHSIEENLKVIQQRVKEACDRVGRDPEEIEIIPVTKTVAPQRMIEALKLGFTTVGENRIQEAEEKIEQMKGGEYFPKWHFIGHLQSNKVKNVVQFASMIQSMDRIKIARRLNRELEELDRTMDVLVQVNVSNEESKYGISPDKSAGFIKELASFERLHIKGLMTIGLFSDDWPKVRMGFRKLREIRDEIEALKIEHVSMKYLSMGMTNDFELAIEEGANMIRVGRALFGERGTPDSFYWPGIKTSN